MTVRGVLAGEVVVTAVKEGTGFVRRPAPGDGLLIETADAVHFVPFDVASAAVERIHGLRLDTAVRTSGNRARSRK